MLLPPKIKTPAPALVNAPAPLRTPFQVLVKPVPQLNVAVPALSRTLRVEENEAVVVSVAAVGKRQRAAGVAQRGVETDG